jgi:hypothetical protein
VDSRNIRLPEPALHSPVALGAREPLGRSAFMIDKAQLRDNSADFPTNEILITLFRVWH